MRHISEEGARKVRERKKMTRKCARARAREGEEEGSNGCREGTWCYAIFLPTFPKEFIITRYDASSYFHRMQNRECYTWILSHKLYRSASQSYQFVDRDGVDPTRDTLGCSSTLFKLLSNLAKISFDTIANATFSMKVQGGGGGNTITISQRNDTVRVDPAYSIN